MISKHLRHVSRELWNKLQSMSPIFNRWYVFLPKYSFPKCHIYISTYQVISYFLAQLWYQDLDQNKSLLLLWTLWCLPNNNVVQVVLPQSIVNFPLQTTNFYQVLNIELMFQGSFQSSLIDLETCPRCFKLTLIYLFYPYQFYLVFIYIDVM